VRLVFSSGVRDIDAMGEVVPLGADASAERARELFRLLSAAGEPSADTIIGQADADGDNIADVCVEGAGAQRDAAVLIVACEDGAAVVAPDGAPCTTPIVRPPSLPPPCPLPPCPLAAPRDLRPLTLMSNHLTILMMPLVPACSSRFCPTDLRSVCQLPWGTPLVCMHHGEMRTEDLPRTHHFVSLK